MKGKKVVVRKLLESSIAGEYSIMADFIERRTETCSEKEKAKLDKLASKAIIALGEIYDMDMSDMISSFSYSDKEIKAMVNSSERLNERVSKIFNAKITAVEDDDSADVIIHRYIDEDINGNLIHMELLIYVDSDDLVSVTTTDEDGTILNEKTMG